MQRNNLPSIDTWPHAHRLDCITTILFSLQPSTLLSHPPVFLLLSSQSSDAELRLMLHLLRPPTPPRCDQLRCVERLANCPPSLSTVQPYVAFRLILREISPDWKSLVFSCSGMFRYEASFAKRLDSPSATFSCISHAGHRWQMTHTSLHSHNKTETDTFASSDVLQLVRKKPVQRERMERERKKKKKHNCRRTHMHNPHRWQKRMFLPKHASVF